MLLLSVLVRFLSFLNDLNDLHDLRDFRDKPFDFSKIVGGVQRKTGGYGVIA